MDDDADIKEAFGHILRQLRVRSHLSQERLAHDCHLDPTYISLLERGKRGPTLETLWALSERLGLLPSEFVRLVEVEIAQRRRPVKGEDLQ